MLDDTMLVIASGSSDFITLFRELIKDDFTQSESAMIHFINRKVLLALWPCFSLFSSIVI